MYEKMKAAQMLAESMGTIISCGTIEGGEYTDPGFYFSGTTGDGKKFTLTYHEENGDDS